MEFLERTVGVLDRPESREASDRPATLPVLASSLVSQVDPTRSRSLAMVDAVQLSAISQLRTLSGRQALVEKRVKQIRLAQRGAGRQRRAMAVDQQHDLRPPAPPVFLGEWVRPTASTAFCVRKRAVCERFIERPSSPTVQPQQHSPPRLPEQAVLRPLDVLRPVGEESGFSNRSTIRNHGLAVSSDSGSALDPVWLQPRAGES